MIESVTYEGRQRRDRGRTVRVLLGLALFTAPLVSCGPHLAPEGFPDPPDSFGFVRDESEPERCFRADRTNGAEQVLYLRQWYVKRMRDAGWIPISQSFSFSLELSDRDLCGKSTTWWEAHSVQAWSGVWAEEITFCTRMIVTAWWSTEGTIYLHLDRSDCVP